MSKQSLIAFFAGWLCLCSGFTFAADPAQVVNVWPGKAPGDTMQLGAERVRNSTNAAGPQKEVFDVSVPTLEIFRPAKEKDTGVSIVIIPGGGFGVLKMDYEGEDCATWLNTIGVTGIVLKYRVPQRPAAPNRYFAALQDTQRAMSVVRAHAAEWNLDPKRVGLLGFSAGSVVGAVAESNYDKRSYASVDDVDKTSCRPDFSALIYPGQIVEKDGTLISDVTVSKQTPATFIAVADSDKTENAVAVYTALKKAGVSAELHIYADGEHGFGMRPTTQPHGTWNVRFEEWMVNQGILKGTEKGK
jgi:acetyl esterase/lipase